MDFAQLSTLAGGFAEARALQVGIKIGLFECLAGGARDARALAEELRCDRRGVHLLANALVAMGLLAGSSQGYQLSPAARRFLLAEAPEYLGGMILFDEALTATWVGLEDAVRSGAPARMPDMYQSRPEETRRFIVAMDSLVRARGDARYLASNLAALELDNIRTLADLGGAAGTYGLELMRVLPGLEVTILELPATLAVARQLLRAPLSEPQLGARLRLVECDYSRRELPGNFDAILLSNIIHSEGEELNRALMAKCWRALAPGGRLIVKDHLMNDQLTEPLAGALFALYLLLTTAAGRDYALTEVAAWCRSAGFEHVRHHRLPAPPFSSSLLIAEKPLSEQPLS